MTPPVPQALQPLLMPFAWLYRWLVVFRRWALEGGLLTSVRLPGKVISVGNLQVGGTGKSPVVQDLAAWLLRQGARPAILARGYRSGLHRRDSMAFLGEGIIMSPVTPGEDTADEARMLARALSNVPVIIGARRGEAARRYLQKYSAPTHWILDDGFQHMQISRDLDILLLDGRDPLGGSRLLPAGILREPPGAIRSADVILLTRSPDGAGAAEKVRPWLRSPDTPLIPLTFRNGPLQWRAGPNTLPETGAPVLLVSAIAGPADFEAGVRATGLRIVHHLRLRDHSELDPAKIADMTASCTAIVTTEKDFWRNPRVFKYSKKPVCTLPLHTGLSDEMIRQILDPLI